MTTLNRLHDQPLQARLATAGALALALVALALGFSSPAKADSTSCSDSVTSAPTGPATVSAETKPPFGKVLVVGSGTYAGCSLYLLTSDQLHALSGGATPYGCSDNANDLGAPCDTVLWPALLTNGAPIAGPGINPTLLGTVTRTDITGLPAVQQVTYAGQPLYRFIFDESSDEIEGANLFDPVTSPPGTWYLVDPSRGLPATGTAQLQLETAPVNGTGPNETVLAATMSNDFTTLFPPGGAPFPVYTSSADSGHRSACQGACSAANWQPVLTSGRAQAGPGVDQHAVGIIVRPDGTHQVTYNGKPLYLNFGDAYLAGVPFYNNGMPTINGAGAVTPWGVFNTIPAL
jgi:predicted lipoprotein with Yx(FWY)xxD motif